jgi:hypothetical protein
MFSFLHPTTAKFLQLLNMLFPSMLLDVLRVGSAQNIFTLLACGSVLKCESSFAELKMFAKK